MQQWILNLRPLGYEPNELSDSVEPAKCRPAWNRLRGIILAFQPQPKRLISLIQWHVTIANRMVSEAMVRGTDCLRDLRGSS
jgi:hypothetical protein